MGWDKGRYYTRSYKVDGRVFREYLGRGRLAEIVADLDAQVREQRQWERSEIREKKNSIDAFEAELRNLDETAELVARAALQAAGYHQHKRGEWRKKRER
jgi:hypothetical protein